MADAKITLTFQIDGFIDHNGVKLYKKSFEKPFEWLGVNANLVDYKFKSVSHPATDEKNVRMTIDMTPEMYNKISEMASLLNVTKAGLLRKALALLDVAIDVKKGLKKLGTFSEGKVLIEEIVGF